MVQFQIDAGVSVLHDVKVANGGLGGEQNVDSRSLEALMVSGQWGEIPLEFQVRVFGESGESEKGLAGQGNTTVQPNGGTQFIQGAGGVSGNSTREVEFWRAGGELQFNLPGIQGGAGTFVPFFGAGFEHSQLDTRLFANWIPFQFHFEDLRTVKTNRAYVFIGGRHAFARVGDIDFFAQGQLQLNGDFVNADGTYNTGQVGNFFDSVRGSVNKSVVTVGGRTRLEFKAFGSYMPVWEAEYLINQFMNVKDDPKWGWGVTGGFRFAFDRYKTEEFSRADTAAAFPAAFGNAGRITATSPPEASTRESTRRCRRCVGQRSCRDRRAG
jgi:hypothetical protein